MSGPACMMIIMTTTKMITQLRSELMKALDMNTSKGKDVWMETALRSLRDLECHLDALPQTDEHHVIVTRGQWRSLTQLLGMIQPKEQS